VVSARRKGQREEFDERILGSGDFVNTILKEAEEKTWSQLKLRRIGKTIIKIIDEECARDKVSPHEPKGGSRRRKVCVLRAAIARHAGVTTSSVARAVVRLEEVGKSIVLS